MKQQLLVLSAVATFTALTGCSSTGSSNATVSQEEYDSAKSSYEAKLASQNAELARLRNETAAANARAQSASANASAKNSTPVYSSQSELFPPNPQPGHCYARLLTPAKYKSTTEQVLIREAGESVSVIPAKYAPSSERVLVKEATTKIVAVPATYKTVREQILVKPGTVQKVAVPAKYKTVTERVLDKPAHTVWKRGSGFQNQALKTSYDQSTGEIMCLVEVPATYKTVSKRVLVSPATTIDKDIAGVYKTITRTVVDQPATTKTIQVPAVYSTIKTTKLVQPAREIRNPIPAKYDTVTKREKITDSSLAWSEVICQDNINKPLVVDLQRSLKNAGYYSGPIDGIYGRMTQSALNSYSSKKGLAKSGSYIPLNTAEKLGIKL